MKSNVRRFVDSNFLCQIVTIGGKTYEFKSSWEINYARWLQWLKEDRQILDWKYEPDIFYYTEIKKGTKAYKPDFKVFLTDGSYEYHEVKGYMDAKSKVKLKRFLKYYPNIAIKLAGIAWFKRYTEQLKKIIPEWI